MGCRTLIGATAAGDAYTARWLHWGERPSRLVPVLRRIWQDTFAGDAAALVAALLSHDWSHLDPELASDRVAAPVPGVGYVSPGGTGALWRHHLTDEINPDLQWLYLVDIATDTVLVYEATRHSRWLLHSRHPLNAHHTASVLGCGGYTALGHQWQPTGLRIPGERAVFDAEACTAGHPGRRHAVRLTDAVATHITDTVDPAAVARASRGRVPHLRRVGVEFDLVFPDTVFGGLDQPSRIPRDADGRLLLTGPLWRWRLTSTKPPSPQK